MTKESKNQQKNNMNFAEKGKIPNFAHATATD